MLTQTPWDDLPDAPHPRLSAEERRAQRAAWQREYRARVPLTPEQKAAKRILDKLRQQTPTYKAKAAARYQRKRQLPT